MNHMEKEQRTMKTYEVTITETLQKTVEMWTIVNKLDTKRRKELRVE